MHLPSRATPAPRAKLVVCSDLDGTLLDHATYSFDAARPALDRLASERIPLVLCSSKTRAELEPLRRAIGTEAPFVVENGGALFIPERYFDFAIDGGEPRDRHVVVRQGAPYADLVAALERASRESGVRVRGFASMDAGEVAEATGLPLDDARHAKAREFDEPFEILDEHGAPALLAALEHQGYRWTAGGRFHHVMGSSDKGASIRILASLYRKAWGAVTTVGLGDAPNDASLLREVDLPFVVASPRAQALHALVPHACLTSATGPAGWNASILALLDSLDDATAG